MKRPVHYWWRRRFQFGIEYEFVDTACGIEVEAERATENFYRVTCKRCKRCGL